VSKALGFKPKSKALGFKAKSKAKTVSLVSSLGGLVP